MGSLSLVAWRRAERSFANLARPQGTCGKSTAETVTEVCKVSESIRLMFTWMLHTVVPNSPNIINVWASTRLKLFALWRFTNQARANTTQAECNMSRFQEHAFADGSFCFENSIFGRSHSICRTSAQTLYVYGISILCVCVYLYTVHAHVGLHCIIGVWLDAWAPVHRMWLCQHNYKTYQSNMVPNKVSIVFISACFVRYSHYCCNKYGTYSTFSSVSFCVCVYERASDTTLEGVVTHNTLRQHTSTYVNIQHVNWVLQSWETSTDTGFRYEWTNEQVQPRPKQTKPNWAKPSKPQ
jgi:hypothetical protein